MRPHPLRLGLVAGVAVVALAGGPSLALGDTVASSNWSGYAVHRAGLKFRQVSASWVQPKAACSNGQETYSSFWVGLGGYRTNAAGLEQIGSELDCTAFGQQRSSVWYELVPAPSHPIRMTVKPGDRLSASVTVVGNRVAMRLVDHTRGKSFFKRFTTRNIDVTSADWIAEAPSTCNATGSCQTLPLANFGTARFTGAVAKTTAGRRGRIASAAWNTTRLVLSESASPFSGAGTQRMATPSGLKSDGAAFAVQYGQSSGLLLGRTSAAATVAGTGTVQPGGVRH